MRITRRALLSMMGGLGASRLLSSTAPPLPTFEEIPPSASGISWVHENAMSPMRYLPETMGPGVAFLDYDNDGWMDIYLVNYGRSSFYTPPQPIRSALYRNNGDGTFTNVAEKAGLGADVFKNHWSTSAVWFDYDNDGRLDLFVCSFVEYG